VRAKEKAERRARAMQPARHASPSTPRGPSHATPRQPSRPMGPASSSSRPSESTHQRTPSPTFGRRSGR
jgi:hypothetical protein